MTKNHAFGEALEAVKKGARISREGWNWKGMFVCLNAGSYDFPTDAPREGAVIDRKTGLRFFLIDGVRHTLFSRGDHGTATRLPNLNMLSATGSTVTGWLASQTDMLAEDWCIEEVPAPAEEPRLL